MNHIRKFEGVILQLFHSIWTDRLSNFPRYDVLILESTSIHGGEYDPTKIQISALLHSP